MRFLHLTLLSLLGPSAGTAFGKQDRGPRDRRPAVLEQKRLERERDELMRLAKRDEVKNGTVTEGFRYYNNQTSKYHITSLPDVNYDLGEIYSGLIPLNQSDPSTGLFFVFQPTVGEKPVDEITIWLNGGPGCSSLEGFFEENGRFTWATGQYEASENQYSWVNLTNMLWVEYPVGVGFSIGTPKADNQEDIAKDFLAFFRNFQDTFGIKNYKIYVTGESYAGRYVPYVSAAMIDANNTEYYNVSGALVYDPCIGEFVQGQEQVPTYPFVEANNEIFNLNDTYLAELKGIHEQCGYQSYIDQYLQFPPVNGNQPELFFNYTDQKNASCDIFDLVYLAALTVNPCFSVYEITQMCPMPGDILSPALVPGGHTPYFDRPEVKKAIHAPDNVNWSLCTTNPVFTGGNGGPQSEGDLSADPIQKVLPQVIEKTNRVLVSNGDYDFILITNGTLLAIQNMTWAGQLGFQSPPNQSIIIEEPELQYVDYYGGSLGGQGLMGVQHYERGLMWAQTFQSGHMQPQFQSRVAYRHLQWLLGHIEEL